MASRQSGGTWWSSLYWRIGVSFVLCVFGLSVAQSLIFAYRVRRDARDMRSSPNALAADVAFAVSRGLADGHGLDLDVLQRARADSRNGIHVVLRDGTVESASEAPLDPNILAAARLLLDPSPTEGDAIPRTRGPVVIAPIQVAGQLQGLVVMPPRAGNLMFEVMKYLSAPSFAALMAVTALAAFVIFRPAHRRLAALEAATERMGQGDLQARAPETGGDEIAAVAAAFNRMGDEIAARDEALRRVDRLRRQMLADVSHELRTPLTAMRGFIDTLKMPEIDADAERRARYFATLSRETQRLERIVADLLDVARLEHGVAEFEVRTFDVRRLFEQVARRQEQAAGDRGVALVIGVDEAADQITGDPHRLEQAVDNLVVNALRHTPAGGTVTMRTAVDGDRVLIAVEDTGAGIAAEHLDHVFDRFYKADPSRAATHEGSGLGLSIVRAIVERHGGEIRVASRPGATRFSIQLPHDAPA